MLTRRRRRLLLCPFGRFTVLWSSLTMIKATLSMFPLTLVARGLVLDDAPRLASSARDACDIAPLEGALTVRGTGTLHCVGTRNSTRKIGPCQFVVGVKIAGEEVEGSYPGPRVSASVRPHPVGSGRHGNLRREGDATTSQSRL